MPARIDRRIHHVSNLNLNVMRQAVESFFNNDMRHGIHLVTIGDPQPVTNDMREIKNLRQQFIISNNQTITIEEGFVDEVSGGSHAAHIMISGPFSRRREAIVNDARDMYNFLNENVATPDMVRSIMMEREVQDAFHNSMHIMANSFVEHALVNEPHSIDQNLKLRILKNCIDAAIEAHSRH